LADVVEVKTGSRSTAHWRIHFIRPNGWLRHSFAQLITLLDIDRIGQNWEGSNTSHISTLRSSLDTHFLELPAATRQALHRSISTPFGAFSDPMAALTFYLDGSWIPARGRVAGLRWGKDGRTLPAQRDAAVEKLAGGDSGLLEALRRELREVLAFLGHPEQEEACREVHPLT